MLNRKFFFDQVRLHLFDGRLRKSQVDGLTTLLDAWEAKHAAKDDRWLAYLLATAHHETDRTMQPISEYGGPKYFTRQYDPPPGGLRPKVARELGNDAAGDGAKYHGRGYVQLTGKRNYGDWKRRLGEDLLANPELAKRTDIAARILIEGAIRGTFTGRKLGDYFGPGKEDWSNARRIINKLDKAELTKGYARKYYAALSHTT